MQTIPEYLKQLLDLAAEKAGSDYAVAKALGMHRQQVSNWRTGQRTCTPEDVAQLAAIAGLEPEKWMIRAVLAKYEGTPKGDRLYKALGKSLLATGAVIATSGAAAQQIFLIKPVVYFIRCIDLLTRKRPFATAF